MWKIIQEIKRKLKNIKSDTINMSNGDGDDDGGGGLLALLLGLAGAAAGFYILKRLAEGRSYFCPRCTGVISYRTPTCPNCHLPFRWG